MITDLQALLQSQPATLASAADAAQARDEAAFAGAISGVIVEYVTEVSLLGRLTKPMVMELIQRSAYGRAQKALTELEAEQTEAERHARVLQALREVLEPAQEALKAGVEELGARLEALEARPFVFGDIAIVRQRYVEGEGAVGVHFEGPIRGRAEIDQHRIGAGATGVKFGALGTPRGRRDE